VYINTGQNSRHGVADCNLQGPSWCTSPHMLFLTVLALSLYRVESMSLPLNFRSLCDSFNQKVQCMCSVTFDARSQKCHFYLSLLGWSLLESTQPCCKEDSHIKRKLHI
jgi:hypothetical protein